MTDQVLIDKEVKLCRHLYQMSVSTGFYIGAHVAAALGSSGFTVPAAVLQLSWQAFQAVQASYKHDIIVKEIYRRGLKPRAMTKAEMAQTAFCASLSIALGEAIDSVASALFQSATSDALANASQVRCLHVRILITI